MTQKAFAFQVSVSKYIAAVILGAGIATAVSFSAHAQNAATAMASDPSLSEWTYIVGQAGLTTAAATNTVTVFAVTNEGFDQINAVWHGALKTPGATGAPNFQRMQELVRSQAVFGLHAPSEFAGKNVTLTSVAGTPITIDGTVAGKLTITMEHAVGSVEGTPITTSQAVIYPIVVSDVHP